ncbi:Transcription factor bHLH25 like [Actinidia chinensis var. chinensis]|uniref:Transcription factor bHLH25 like n=1 Tax=Actinidia chinensis var. chinensis TaxID=1590841 RepID=A0A2R6S178_ACTCC|nr:Transcription factor bHLH25 like [Actinidia chinensis var. chinensis]
MADSPMPWLAELGMEDPLFPSDIMESFEEELAAVLGEEYQQHYSFSSESNSSNSPNLIPTSSSTTNLLGSSPTELAQQDGSERPTKHHKPNNTCNSWPTTTITSIPSIDHQAAPSGSSTRFILSFGNSNLTEIPKVPLGTVNPQNEAVAGILMSQGSIGNREEGVAKSSTPSQGAKKTSTPRPASQTYDHIIAERKRREQLSQLFVALSGIVPGLKKMDKTSVLGEAVKYLKQLQERVKTLEEQSTKQTMESVVLVKKSQLLLEDEAGSSDDNFVGGASKPLPEIEARLCNKNVLLRIHCEKHKGLLVKILSEMENLNLSVINTSVTRFGSLALDITIIAEMETESCLTVKDLVSNLLPALRHFV